ncbi:amidohydrolase family protein, partial [Microbacterium sp. UBA6741]
LGGNPQVLSRLAVQAVAIDYAGAFLTAPGGYPSDRDWAPEGSVREITDADSAAAAVAGMAAAGATRLKVTSNSAAGPVLSDDLFRAIVRAADEHGLAVVAHAEGAGEAQRVVRLGASHLAHAPFTERLDDAEVVRQAASASWISTLAIHEDPERAIAMDNVRRFHAAGGTVLYGTDLGNGPMPVDLNPREIAALREAGLDDAALLRALAPGDPFDPTSVLLLSGGPASTADPLDARPLTPADLKV